MAGVAFAIPEDAGHAAELAGWINTAIVDAKSPIVLRLRLSAVFVCAPRAELPVLPGEDAVLFDEAGMRIGGVRLPDESCRDLRGDRNAACFASMLERSFDGSVNGSRHALDDRTRTRLLQEVARVREEELRFQWGEIRKLVVARPDPQGWLQVLPRDPTGEDVGVCHGMLRELWTVAKQRGLAELPFGVQQIELPREPSHAALCPCGMAVVPERARSALRFLSGANQR